LTGKIYRPGERCPRSGQYGVCNASGRYMGREATVVQGEPFPPVNRVRGEYGWRLRDATVHR
jgi:hypothetical protein